MHASVKGMYDLLPGSAGGSVELRQRLERCSAEIFETFGYREIRTPLLEEKALFVKSIGDETDIVTKEMFAFRDRGGRDVALRPEGTAPIVRAYLEANLHKTAPFQKFYYIGPMFRAERPQAGRMRQFHQIGAEAIGSHDPAIDAEMILLMMTVLDASRLKGQTLRLNNLGCRSDKARLSKKLKELFSGKKALLCEDCRKRLETNPLRVIDCKKENCRSVVRGALASLEFLCPNCAGHFSVVRKYLDLAGVQYVIDPYIVRGLDYYTGTVFEVSHPDLGAQDALGAGGRYDNLVSDLGGPSLGAVGFALGVERMLIAAAKQGATAFAGKTPPPVFIATLGEEARKKGFELVNALRSVGVACEMDYEGKSLKAQMRKADDMCAPLVVIVGDDELKSGSAVIRDMKSKEQSSIKMDEVVDFMEERVKRKT